MAAQYEAEQCGGCVVIGVDMIHIDCADSHEVTVLTMTGWRRGPDKAPGSRIVAELPGAFRQAHPVFISRSFRQLRDVRRDVRDCPVPETRSGWRVRIIDGDHEALGLLRNIAPRKMRTPVLSLRNTKNP